jgi:hypothetical protein
VKIKIKRRRSILGLALACCYLLGAVALTCATACGEGEHFICGKIIGALVAAIPRPFPFFSNEGEIGTMIAVCVAGIAVNAVIIMCGWAVEGAFRSKRLP